MLSNLFEHEHVVGHHEKLGYIFWKAEREAHAHFGLWSGFLKIIVKRRKDHLCE